MGSPCFIQILPIKQNLDRFGVTFSTLTDSMNASLTSEFGFQLGRGIHGFFIRKNSQPN